MKSSHDLKANSLAAKLLRRVAAIAIGSILLLNAACSGSSAPTTESLSGKASLGAINNAVVNIYAADGTTLIATTMTDASGSFSITAPANVPLVIEVVGDALASYFDESSNGNENFPASTKIRAIIPVAGSDVAVSILTELAYQLAVNNSFFPLTADEVNRINSAVSTNLAPGLTGVNQAPSVIDTNSTNNTLTNSNAGRYALVLAALAELAQGQPSPALVVLNALIEDVKDGNIDGKNGSLNLTTPYNDFVNDLTAALNTMAAKYADSTLQAVVNDLVPSGTNIGNDVGNGNAGNAVNQNLVGQYTLKALSNSGASPFTDNQMVMAELTSQGQLTVGSVVMNNPSEVGIELLWTDSSTGIRYDLSNNTTGVFNEINLIDTNNGNQFIGQLVEAGDNGGNNEGPENISLVTALTGTYTVTGTSQGSHSRSTITIEADGSIDFDTNIDLRRAEINAIFDRLACCNRITVDYIQGAADSANLTPRLDLFVDEGGNLIRLLFLSNGLDSSSTDVTVSPAGGS